MKHFALVVLALAACSKPNDIQTLWASADAIASYYKPRVAELQTRMEHLIEKSKQLVNPGDRDAAEAAFADAADASKDMHAAISTSKQQANALASAGKRSELERLVEEEQDKLASAEERIAEDLATDDSWIADQMHTPAAPRPPAPEAPPTP